MLIICPTIRIENAKSNYEEGYISHKREDNSIQPSILIRAPTQTKKLELLAQTNNGDFIN